MPPMIFVASSTNSQMFPEQVTNGPPLIGQDSTRSRIQMKTSAKDEIKGTLHEVKGKIKEKAGQITNRPDLETEGKSEHIAGKVEKKIG